jgi:hypothetical protein
VFQATLISWAAADSWAAASGFAASAPIARTLTGSQSSSGAYVTATLEALVEEPAPIDVGDNIGIALYRVSARSGTRSIWQLDHSPVLTFSESSRWSRQTSNRRQHRRATYSSQEARRFEPCEREFKISSQVNESLALSHVEC